MIDNINEYVYPVDPYFLVEVVKGVSTDKVEVEDSGLEIPSDNKYEGQFMDICRVLKCYDDSSKDMIGKLVLSWSTAVKPFDLPSLGSIFLLKKADIFAILDEKALEDLSKDSKKVCSGECSKCSCSSNEEDSPKVFDNSRFETYQ